MANLEQIRVLLIDDDEDDYILTKDLLKEIQNVIFIVDWEPHFEQALQAVLNAEHDVYLVDYHLGRHTGLDLIRQANQANCREPMILLTGQGDLVVDYEAMQEGAADYLVKGSIDARNLERSIRYALTHARNLQAIEAKEQRYRSLFEQSSDAIFTTNRELLFIDANPSLLRLLDYNKDEVMKMNLKEIFKYEDDFLRLKEGLLKEGHMKDFEAVLLHKNQEALYCIVTSNALSSAEQYLYGYQGIIRDISLQKKAEQEFLMAEKLSVTGKIARSIAHEVRNPLTNLNLALEQLVDELPDPEEQDSVDLYVDIIKRNAKRIEQLISELLQSSKPNQLHLEEYSVNEVIEETLRLISDRVHLRDIKLEKELAPELSRILLDREKVKTALLNIIINAIEAMDSQSGLLKIKSTELAQFIKVEVQDNGTGIAADKLTKLFDPFFTEKSNGMGLGLTTTKNIINSHQGEIQIDSELGKGTNFQIFLRKELSPSTDNL